MITPRFLQFHFLSSYPGALLNRDDSGLAKRLPFGRAVRTRVSSQCLKRHWRMTDDVRGLHTLAKSEGVEALRSKNAIEAEITGPLRGEHDEKTIDAIEAVFLSKIYGSKAKPKKKGDDSLSDDSRQALLLGRPELDFLALAAQGVARESGCDAKAAKAAAEALFKKDGKANFDQIKAQNALAPGLESALFGRMVTSDVKANTDASIHVAHAFTVHEEQPELDYFTVVDDLSSGEDAGAAGIFDTELTSGLYYGYVVVDVPLLVSNLSGCARGAWQGDVDRRLAAKVVENLVHLIATVSPGAKKGSTAPYVWADLVLLEAGDRQPRTLANAFRDPVETNCGQGGLLEKTVSALGKELSELDGMYGAGEVRLVAQRGATLADVEAMSLPDLAQRAAQFVERADA